VRGWFEGEGFVEVEAAALQVSPGNETHLHAFQTAFRTIDGRSAPAYLHTSPEFAMKKLLAAGEEKIFDFARVFRNRERSALHAPEFTMLEWYRQGESYSTVVADSVAVLRLAADTAGASQLSYRGLTCDPRGGPQRLTVAAAFARFARIDLFATVESDGTTRRDALAEAATGVGVRVAPDDSWSDIFSRVMSEKVEPQLGVGWPTVLFNYPISEAALARRNPDEPRIAERFELFACGVELANGFGELTDPEEQRRRFVADMDEKERIYGERYPIDEDFLAAIGSMPAASGVALGFDRLVMLATGAVSVEEVQWTKVHDPF
jgi:lysyl-tRNA synthetase class 2